MIESTPLLHWFMHTPHAAIGMGGNKQNRFELATAPQETRTLRVGVLVGREVTYEATERLLQHFASEAGVRAGRAWDGSSEVDEMDCLVLLGWSAAENCRRLKQIELYCRGGGNVIALRTLAAEMPGWPDFAEEVFGGRQAASRQHRLLEAERSDVAWHHPVLEDMVSLIAEGEVYRGPRLAPSATVLLTADDGRGRGPVAWTTRHAGGRVFCTTLGHEDDFREAAFLQLITNAARWTALAQRG